jgi:hypothetical protein
MPAPPVPDRVEQPPAVVSTEALGYSWEPMQGSRAFQDVGQEGRPPYVEGWEAMRGSRGYPSWRAGGGP